jgi:hypothetical protein
MTLKATRESTGGAYGLVDSWVPAGASPPLHVHHREDEAFYVIEGEQPAHLLTLISPGGGERFLVDAGRTPEGGGLPPAGPPDLERLGRFLGPYENELVGAPLRPRSKPA